jgi:L-ascorbate metabolism protein UlaG (beta-lactamase superfamily)
VLVDPGTFADDLSDLHDLRDLSAVLVTHQHPDHLDPERVPALVAANPGAVVLCDPGSVDVLDAEPGAVDVLAFPLQAPWQRSRDMTAFLRRLAAPHAVPVHDGLLQARGRGLYLNQAGQLGSPDTRIHDLAGAGPTQFRAGE